MPSSGKNKPAEKNPLDSILGDITSPFCGIVDEKYERLAKVGQGTFGEVFKAQHKKTKRIVALKKVLMENETEGFPITALREIKIFQKMSHENVVELLEICTTKATAQNNYKSQFYLVFEFCEHDLAGLLRNKTVPAFNQSEIKHLMKQLMNALFYIHSSKILHRDMKAANILITKQGVLKLADFGLARAFSFPIHKPNRYTNRVVTLWFRPPELLLGDRNYSTGIDMWGAGCIMAEMWTRNPILQGRTEQEQLKLIIQLCGSITTESWPGVDQLELFKSMELPQGNERKVKQRLRYFISDTQALSLVDRLLTLDPTKRINADDSLNHEYFWTGVEPQPMTRILSQLKTSNFDYLASQQSQAQHQPSRHAPQQQASKQPIPEQSFSEYTY